MHLEDDQSVRSMKLSLAAYSTKNIAAVGAWVLLKAERRRADGGVQSEEGGQDTQLGGVEAGEERPAVSTRGGALRPNMRKLDRVD